jgi:predicted metal-dependent peptidase
MTDAYLPAWQAEGKIRIAIERLAGRYPFHTRVLERFRLVARPDVGTMGVTVSGDDVLLLHNPAFALDTPADQLGGVLLHEVHHVVLGHVLADPDDFPDDWARTVAEEVTVNEFVKEPLPADVITLEQFPALPPMGSTRRSYERLRQRKRRQPIGTPSRAAGTEDARGSDGPPRPQGGAGHRRRAVKARPGGAEQGGSLQTADDHTVWAGAREDPGRSRGAIREVIEQAVLAVQPDQIPDELRGAVEAFGIGTSPGGGREELLGGGRGRLDWQRLLRRHVGQAFEVRPAFNRPPRRFPELAGVVPGQRRQSTRPRIMAVIDTSGSVTTELLQLINAEVARLARHYCVKVVQCDAAIQCVFNYRPPRDMSGRGGTDLRPPLERAFLRTHRPDLVVYFTDGQGPAPERPPGPPVIWCLAPQGKRPAPWGQAVWMGGPP